MGFHLVMTMMDARATSPLERLDLILLWSERKEGMLGPRKSVGSAETVERKLDEIMFFLKMKKIMCYKTKRLNVKCPAACADE